MKKNEGNKEKLSAGQLLKNCLFAVGELFKNSPVYETLFVIETVVSAAFTAFMSTYYVKILVNMLEEGATFKKAAVMIVGFCAAQVSIFVFENLLSYYEFYNCKLRYAKKFNLRLFGKAANVELECYEDPVFYDKYTRALDGLTDKIFNVFYLVIDTLSRSFSVIYLLVYMMSVDPGVGLFMIFPMIGNFIIGKKLNVIEQKRYRENTKYSRMRSYVTRTLHLSRYSKEMRLTDVYGLVQDKHKRSVDGTNKVYDKFALKSGFTYWVKVQFTFLLIFEPLLIYCAYKAIVSETMSLADLTVLTSIMATATWEIIRLSDSVVQIQERCIYIQNARDFLGYEEKIPEDGGGIRVPDVIESVEFRNVTFSYKGADGTALKDVSFRIERGEHVALVGRNGAGKSTLVKLLLRLYDPDEGQVLLNGVNIKEYRVADLREAFSTAFQDYQVLAMTVLENLTASEPEEGDRQRAEEVLKKVGLWEKVSRLENGLDAVLTREFDDGGIVLSGGEAQKLAVARALMNRSKFSVFDEPTGALDPIAEYELFETIMEDTAGLSALIISHRLTSAKLADRIIVLENGELCDEGTHEELINKDGLYREMFVSQARNYLADDEIGGAA